MVEHRKKRPRDLLALAKLIGDVLNGRTPKTQMEGIDESEAAKWGRLGGANRGPIRAAKLSAEQRRKIARHAAQSRWKKQSG